VLCAQNDKLNRHVLRYCLKVRDDEQSVMKSGKLYQARGPGMANVGSPTAVHHVTGTSRADEDDDRSRRREVTSATG